jgi:hypothetical protein
MSEQFEKVQEVAQTAVPLVRTLSVLARFGAEKGFLPKQAGDVAVNATKATEIIADPLKVVRQRLALTISAILWTFTVIIIKSAIAGMLRSVSTHWFSIFLVQVMIGYTGSKLSKQICGNYVAVSELIASGLLKLGHLIVRFCFEKESFFVYQLGFVLSLIGVLQAMSFAGLLISNDAIARILCLISANMVLTHFF